MAQAYPVSVTLLSFYSPSLLLSVALTMRHGLRQSFAWAFMAIFSLIRIAGAILRLVAPVSQATIKISIAAIVLENVGISPLTLIVLGLLERVQDALDNDKLRQQNLDVET